MRTGSATVFSGLLLLGAAQGCNESTPAPPPTPAAETKPAAEPAPPPTTEVDEGTGEVVDDHPVPSLAGEVMRGHFERATEAREALIRADIDRAKQAMAWLASHELGVALPEPLHPLQANMQAAAKTFAEAKNLREGGVALANTLARCGHCHKSAKRGPEIAAKPLPDGAGIPMHMRRHHWAVDEIWASLITADDERLRSAVEALEVPALTAAELGAMGKDPAKLAELDAHVHALAAKLDAAEDEAQRNQAFGHMLATCAVCHRLMGAGPQPIADVQ